MCAAKNFPLLSSLLWKQDDKLQFLTLAALILPKAAVRLALLCALAVLLELSVQSASLSL